MTLSLNRNSKRTADAGPFWEDRLFTDSVGFEKISPPGLRSLVARDGAEQHFELDGLDVIDFDGQAVLVN